MVEILSVKIENIKPAFPRLWSVQINSHEIFLPAIARCRPVRPGRNVRVRVLRQMFDVVSNLFKPSPTFPNFSIIFDLCFRNKCSIVQTDPESKVQTKWNVSQPAHKIFQRS